MSTPPSLSTSSGGEGMIDLVYSEDDVEACRHPTPPSTPPPSVPLASETLMPMTETRTAVTETLMPVTETRTTLSETLVPVTETLSTGSNVDVDMSTRSAPLMLTSFIVSVGFAVAKQNRLMFIGATVVIFLATLASARHGGSGPSLDCPPTTLTLVLKPNQWGQVSSCRNLAPAYCRKVQKFEWRGSCNLQTAADALNTAAAGACKTGGEMGAINVKLPGGVRGQQRDELCSLLGPMRCGLDGWCSLSNLPASPDSLQCLLSEDIMSTCIHRSFVEKINSDPINVTEAGVHLLKGILRCGRCEGLRCN
eukprot:gnl/MRDRNA2_/MRDRNA2_173618_c0_seq1.p1 gnl/MRDRNA2_/MRDRNA2_173618_c0~~gnl/MRDRNA2_/MRDRNA2_173618_c0_seq1.p1  ORF type:complete len:330 (+),score=28.40 gnl/MRDRNA2_/MRDRNA2_173618_c0_seq1:65-991(+)